MATKVRIEFASKPRCRDFGTLKLPIEILNERCLYCLDFLECIKASSKQVYNPSKRISKG